MSIVSKYNVTKSTIHCDLGTLKAAVRDGHKWKGVLPNEKFVQELQQEAIVLGWILKQRTLQTIAVSLKL